MTPPAGTLDGLLAFDLIAKAQNDEPSLILFGQTGASRLQAKSFSIGLAMPIAWDSGAGYANATPSVTFEVAAARRSSTSRRVIRFSAS